VQNLGDRFSPRFGAEIAFAMHADAHGIGVHVALPDTNMVYLHLLGALDFAVDLPCFRRFPRDLMSAQSLRID
jgi:hypothetical protein